MNELHRSQYHRKFIAYCSYRMKTKQTFGHKCPTIKVANEKPLASIDVI